MTHHTPLEGSTCMSCWDDIDSSNYVEYKATESSVWAASGFCEVCVSYLLKAQWELYTSALAKTTCKAEQRRLLKAGPPVNLKDAKALPTPDDAEIHSLWYASDGQEHSAKLEGSLIGEVTHTVPCCGLKTFIFTPLSTVAHLVYSIPGENKVLDRAVQLLRRGRA